MLSDQTKIRSVAGSLQSAANDFVQEAVADWQAAGAELVAKLTGPQRQIVEAAVNDLAVLTFDALTNPGKRDDIAIEQKYVVSTLTSEAGIATLQVEKAVVSTLRNTLLKALSLLAAI